MDTTNNNTNQISLEETQAQKDNIGSATEEDKKWAAKQVKPKAERKTESIQVLKAVKAELTSFKRYNRETYTEVIQRLVKCYKDFALTNPENTEPAPIAKNPIVQETEENISTTD